MKRCYSSFSFQLFARLDRACRYARGPLLNDSATHGDGLIHALLLCKHKLPNNKATREPP